jgi:hypothetical protein
MPAFSPLFREDLQVFRSLRTELEMFWPTLVEKGALPGRGAWRSR